jgi:hypothetical protein
MKIHCRYEPDEWSAEGPKITTPENLEAIRTALEERGPVIVEHWFYRGARGPDRLIFDDYDDLTVYLEEHACAGDAIEVWDWDTVCRTENVLARGKCPDDRGEVPRKGAY